MQKARPAVLPSMNQQNDNCFVCSPDNPAGLHIHFDVTGDKCHAQFCVGPEFDGYRGITHGGIQAAILDDAMANIFCRSGLPAFTVDMHIQYRHPMFSDRLYRVDAELVRGHESRIKTTHGCITDTTTGETVTEATATFLIGRILLNTVRSDIQHECKQEEKEAGKGK